MTQITIQQYLDSLNKYNNSLQQYTHILKNQNTKQAATTVDTWHGILASDFNAVKTEMTKLQDILKGPVTLSDGEHSKLVYEHGSLLNTQNTLAIHLNNTRSEGDLISLAQRKQENNIENNMQAVHDHVYAVFEVIRPGSSAHHDDVMPSPEYKYDLTQDELNTKVMDAHAFYRMIRDKTASGQYNNKQYDKVFFDVSEKLTKNPMTVSDIIKFYQDNGIAIPTSEDFRALIKPEHKDYKDTQQSVRETANNDYISSELTVSYEKAGSNGASQGNAFLVKDADSYYKLIKNQATQGIINREEFQKLYVNVSEKLVHSALTKGQIDNFYAEQGIKPLTATEWDVLITRQEARRTTDNITEKSGDLQFQGTVHINTKENFKLNVDLYHNGQAADTAGVDINAIPDILLKTTQAFNDAFGIRKLDDATNFRVFIFNSREDYLKYNPEPRGHATASDNGNVSSIYLFQGNNNYSDPNDLLRHEFVHALTFQATAKLPIARTFMEGMAEYVLHKMEGTSNADFINKIPAENFDRSIKEIMQNPLNESDHYVTGAALVAFLEETQPHFLDNLLYAARDARQSDKQINMQEMMDTFFQEQGDKPLKDIPWFKTNMSDAKKQALENGTDKATSHTHHAHEHSHGAQGKPADESKSQEPSDTAQHTEQQAESSQPIKIDYFNIEALYKSLSGETQQQQSVLTLWNKLHVTDYQVSAVTKESLDATEEYYLTLLQSQHNADQSFDSEPAVIVNMNMF